MISRIDSESNSAFLFQTDMSHSMMKELRVKGRDRTEVLDSLVRRGVGRVDDAAGIDSLANNIFLKLWESIDSSTMAEAPHGGMFVSLKGGQWKASAFPSDFSDLITFHRLAHPAGDSSDHTTE